MGGRYDRDIDDYVFWVGTRYILSNCFDWGGWALSTQIKKKKTKNKKKGNTPIHLSLGVHVHGPEGWTKKRESIDEWGSVGNKKKKERASGINKIHSTHSQTTRTQRTWEERSSEFGYQLKIMNDHDQPLALYSSLSG